jgi:formylglycine-generating enzyme required for sulfatase activity
MTIEAARKKEIGQQTEQMVRLAPGCDPFTATFAMGRNYDEKEPGARQDQHPATQITMERAFAIGRFPVTNREYRGFCDAMEVRKPPQDAANKAAENHPVVQVSWYEANAFARWLERITGERYRLPTEAEWEYGCRAGTQSLYWWGDNFADGHDYRNLADVNSDSANPWGIWSVYGHVYEWCADPWHENHDGRPQDARVWLENCDSTRRVVRGGSFNWPRPDKEGKEGRRLELRSSYRNEQVPGHIQTNYGFRLARSLSA